MTREESLVWWKNLPQDKKEILAKKHYPQFPFIAVDMSSALINVIANKELL